MACQFLFAKDIAWRCSVSSFQQRLQLHGLVFERFLHVTCQRVFGQLEESTCFLFNLDHYFCSTRGRLKSLHEAELDRPRGALEGELLVRYEFGHFAARLQFLAEESADSF